MILFLSLLLLALLGYTIYSLTNHKDLYAEAEELARTMPMHQLKSMDRGLGGTIWTFFIAGALLTGTFAVQFFSGSDNPTTWTASQMVYAGIGCMMTLAITLAQKSLYSSIHTTKAGLLITAMILLFVIFSEIATSSERTDMLVKHRSESSQVYQGVVKDINRPTTPANVNTAGLESAQAELSDAQYELSRCDRHSSKGAKRVERCEVYEQKRIAKAQGRIDAISNQNQFMATSAMELKLKMIEKAQELQYDENQNPAIIKFMKAVFGGAILYSMIFASLIAVVAFESGFHFTGTRRAVIRHAILLKQNINDPIQQSAPSPTPAPDSDLSTWNAELSKSGIDSPADTALNQAADQAQIERILQRGLGTHEEQLDMPLDSAIKLGIPSESSNPSSELDRRLQGVSEALYGDWNRSVKSGECSHAKAATQKFIWKNTGGLTHTLTANETGRIWNVWLKRGAADGLLKPNPEYKPGNRKPEFILAEGAKGETGKKSILKAKRKNAYLDTEKNQLDLTNHQPQLV